MKKKLILTLTMCALFMCIFVLSVSANDFVASYENYSFTQEIGPVLYVTHNYDGKTCYMLYISDDNGKSIYFVPAKQFQDFVSSVLTEVSYENWFSFCETKYEEGSVDSNYDNFLGAWYNDVYSGLNEEYFNKIMSYKSLTQDDINQSYELGKSDGREEGYIEGYSEGMNDFAEEEKNLIEGYYTQGGNFTAEGLNEYISSNGSDTFKNVHISVGTSSNYFLFEQNFNSSSNSSHGGSSVIVTQQGNNYGASHQGYIDTDCCYNTGYIDGVADGGDIYKGSETYQADIENEINTYMQSEEYTSLMNEYSTEVINNYLKSTEYKASIDSSFIAGELAGEANAYDKAQAEVYGQGVRDGQLNYRNSSEFKDAIDSSYGAGYNKGSEDGKNSVVDPTGVIAMLVIVILLGVVFFIIAKKSKKKR